MIVGLRVDVDTTKGMRDGVPALVALLATHGVRATFFMSVGPDNMGRHVWRLLKPAFLWKMLRSGAAGLYGWDILLRGTFWPGRLLSRFGEQIRFARDAGHEIGLHAWDHYAWQTHVAGFSEAKILAHLRRGREALEGILGERVQCSAVPGWRCTEKVLLAQAHMGFAYHSDCRGVSVFAPVVEGKILAPQVPVTLPTFDEAVGRASVTAENYNDFILGALKPVGLNVYTIHAEVEGGSQLDAFDALLRTAKARGVRFVPLREVLPENAPKGRVVLAPMGGREGWVAQQGDAAA